MLNKPPTRAQEKAWLARITEYGCVITRSQHNLVRHHPIGREGKQNKLWIGRWFVFCLEWDMHHYHGQDPCNVHNHKNEFIKTYGRQSYRFANMCADIKAEDGFLPFDGEVLQAIMDTNA